MPLVCYLLLLAAGLLWVAIDAETAYIFDVFGKNFDYMWHGSGQRWKFSLMYGWRLLSVALLIGICAYLSWQLASAASNRRPAAILLFVTLALVPFCLIPWINTAHRIRFRRTLRNTARQLTPVANQLATAADISEILDDAAYRAESGWSAWHPKNVDDWPEVVPVVYVHAPPATTVLFTYDWETFLAWRLGAQLPHAGSPMPFNGPGETTFKLRQVSKLSGVPEWSLVQVEMRLDDEPGSE